MFVHRLHFTAKSYTKKMLGVDARVLNLEFLETLFGSSALCNLEDVESNGLGDWSALTNGDDVADFNISARIQNERKSRSFH